MDNDDINLNEGIESINIDAKGTGASEEAGDEGGDEEHVSNTMLPNSQSRFPLQSAQTSAKKQKGDGGSSKAKRQDSEGVNLGFPFEILRLNN